MGKYSEKPESTLSKAGIAQLQLEDAIGLFLTERYISAITLAGAADGIFSGLLSQQGELHVAEETWESIVSIRNRTKLSYAGNRTQKEVFNEWNNFRNRLKHHDNRDAFFLELNQFDEAYLAIQRANADGDKLGIVAKNRQEFENWLIENIY